MNILANFKIIKDMEKGLLNGQMEENILEVGKMEKWLEKVLFILIIIFLKKWKMEK